MLKNIKRIIVYFLLLGFCVFGQHVYAYQRLLPTEWSFYVNGRFQYEICYPKMMIPQGEADNGDGQVFLAKNGESLRVSGSYNITSIYDHNLFQWAQEYKQYILEDHGRMTYTLYKPQFAIISGFDKDGNIFYMKLIKGKKDQGMIFILTYPVSSRKYYDSLIPKISSCFKALD